VKLNLAVPADFDLWRTVYSHGWCALPPFSIDKEERLFGVTVRLTSGRIVHLRLSGDRRGMLAIRLSEEKLASAATKELISHLRSMLRIGDDLSGFYKEALAHPDFRWVAETGAGRLLRSQTMFEDAVKMICTTNCSWSLTESMVGNLCRELGEQKGGHLLFPRPRDIAASSEKFLRTKVKLGYRAPFVLEFARRVAEKEIDPEAWRSSTLSSDELFAELRSVKGIGPYAAGNLLKLVGRYDYLGIDSWCRMKFSGIHRKGRAVSDRTIERHYAGFGPMKGLFFWLDVTRDWYGEKFPF
jgi:N-glycosylase/DNA lyase